MPSCDKFPECLVLPAMFRPASRVRVVTAFGANTYGNLDAGAIPAASTFSEHASSHDRTRQYTSKPVSNKGVATHQHEAESRQQATPNVIRRPPRATKSATGALMDDPELAAVIDAWDRLPEAVRAGIVAMVKVAAK